ncbi:MAG: flap endonuclease [Solirubrobacterales bacterium]|jgi:5'-3' exonuclease|nr:flap endonuclease [Solirubrobacterales bacterium]
MSAPLLAVDGPSLIYRAFFALPDSITDDEGRPVNALLGMANLLVQAVEQHDPRAVALCWGAEAATYRVELWPEYHADRPPVPPALAEQFEWAGAFFGALDWHSHVHDTLEADDLLGSLATVETEAGGSSLLFTGDRDMYQCVNDSVRVLWPGGGKGSAEVIDAAGVKQRYGIGPELVPDFIALRGDPSDSIPGGKGIGEKTARDLLLEYGSLEGAIANAVRERPRVQAALREQAHELRAFREMATLVHVPVERPPDTPTNWSGGAAAARERGMNRLAERLEAKAG